MSGTRSPAVLNGGAAVIVLAVVVAPSVVLTKRGTQDDSLTHAAAAGAPADAAPSAPRNGGPQHGVEWEHEHRGNVSVGGGDSVGGEGDLDANVVARVIRGQLSGIRSCHERALPGNPGLSGRVEVRFTIEASGRVSDARSLGMSEAPEVTRCVVSRVRGLVFPAPEGGSVDFSFPFTFNPRG